MRPSLLLLLFIPVLSWAKILTYTYATLSNIVISFDPASGDSEHRLVIPPDYPSYTLTYTCSYDEGSYTLDVEVPDDPPPEEEVEHEDDEGDGDEKVEFETSIKWSVKGSGAIIDGSATEEVVNIRFSEGNTEDVELKVVVTVECTAGNGVGTEESSTFVIYSPVWDPGSSISDYLQGTSISPSSRRAVPVNGTLALSVSLGSSGEQDRRTGATITTPWDSIVHTGGGSPGGGEYSNAAIGGGTITNAGEEGDGAETGSPYWVASVGSFPNGNVGESVIWKAPDTAHKGVVIRVMVDDLAQKPENEAGSADDTATEAGRAQVDVVKPLLEKLISYVKVNDDDDDGNGIADKDDMGPVSGENDLRPAFILAFEPSGMEDGNLVLSDKSDASRIRVWMADTGGTRQPMALPKEWSMTEFDSLQDKTLYVEGLQPSLAVDDTTLEFKYTGNGCTVAATASLTVLRLDLDADANYDGQWSIKDEYLEDNPGVIVLLNDDDDNGNKTMDKDDGGAVENEDDLQKVTLAFAPTNLPGARLKLEASDGNENIKIWTTNDKSGEPLRLPKNYRPGSAADGGGEDSAPPLPSVLYVEGIAEGTAKLKLSFVNDDAIFDEITLHVVKIDLIPDFNRDRKIDIEDQNLLITKGPFRFWVNDDKDEGKVADRNADSDIPGGNNPNHKDNRVNGHRDLLDFFPIWINVKKLIEKQPPNLTFQFSLRQEDSALKIVYTTLSPGNAGAFLTTPCTGCGPNLNQSAEEATTTPVGASAVFPECFVDQLESGNGIAMAEGTATSSSALILEVRNGNHIAFERKMPMSLSGVEDMFRLVNLRNLTQGISLPLEPANLPDEVTEESNIFFLHGFRVTLTGARGWNSEMFKRLWQSASNSRYWGVTWKGDAGIITTFNYHNNVCNAFLTANKLKTLINDSGIPGTKTVMAHSLGNMVVCSAIVDHAMVVGKYFMLNAAVPSEAFGSANISDVSKSRLHHIDWDDYEEKTWSTKWHTYFPNDDRGGLTWIDRFDSLGGNVINFYSNEDEVLMLYSSNDIWPSSGASWWEITEYGNHSWHKQEAFKGRAYNNVFYWACTDWCGWGFEMVRDGDEWVRKYDAATANGLQPHVLAANPVFPLNPAGMNSPTISKSLQNELLAKGIPALSPPCGAGDVSGLEGENMATLKPNGWGRPKDEWLHSDIRNMAFYYTYRLFDKLLGKD